MNLHITIYFRPSPPVGPVAHSTALITHPAQVLQCATGREGGGEHKNKRRRERDRGAERLPSTTEIFSLYYNRQIKKNTKLVLNARHKERKERKARLLVCGLQLPTHLSNSDRKLQSMAA